MKRKHSVFWGFAVLLIAAMFTLAGCGTLGGLFGLPTKTYSNDDGEWQTRPNNDGNLIIVRYIGSRDALLVPAEFEGIPAVEIGERAFYGNTALKSVTIPEGFTGIGADAFDNCTALASIAIPASVIRIGEAVNRAENAFDGCTPLVNITVDAANSVYTAESGVLFNKDKTTLLFCPAGKSGNYTIPSTVIAIEYCAFDACTKLTGITIPNSVTTLGKSAFRDCTGLTSLTIPASIKTITGGVRMNDDVMQGAFESCTGLTSLTISEGVTSIEATAFAYCTSLTSVNIPDSVTYIGGNAFAACTSLTTVTISPVAGRRWDFIIGGGMALFIFKNDPLSNASKTALRNAGYPPPGMVDEF